MKRLVTCISVILSVAALVASCERYRETPAEVPSADGTRTVTATMAPSVSRTSILGLNPVWNAGDEIWVCDEENTAKAVVSSSDDGSSRATLSFNGLSDDAPLFAAYPYGSAVAMSQGSVRVEVSALQDGTFGTSHVAVGYCPSGSNLMSFHNATAMLKFSIDREDIDMIQIHNTWENLCGTFDVNPDNGRMTSEGSSFPTIAMPVSGKGIQYLSCAPCVLGSGSRMSFVTGDGRMGSIVLSSDNTLSAGHLYDMGEIDDRIELDSAPAVNLSASESANCYVVEGPGSYRIKAVKGNSDIPVGEVACGGLLWETDNTTDEMMPNTLVSEVVCSNGYVYFRVADTAYDGNALICAYDRHGNILWSWHIWILERGVGDQTYDDGSDTFSKAVMMDRNLGALSSGGGPASYGFHYQWGRKDPFPGPCSLSSNSVAAMTGTETTLVAANDENGTVEYAIAHPTQFIFRSGGDWLSAKDNTLWSAEAKTIYDPCPAGYFIPFEDAVKGMISSRMDWVSNSSERGRRIAVDRENVWFPAAGERNSSQGRLANVGSGGYYWYDVNTTAQSTACSCWYMTSSEAGVHNSVMARSVGMSVRCQKYHDTQGERQLVVTVDIAAGNTMCSPWMDGNSSLAPTLLWGDGSSSRLKLCEWIDHLYDNAGSYSIVVKGYDMTSFKLKSLGGVTGVDVSGL